MTKMNPFLLLTISALTLQTSVIASTIKYDVETEKAPKMLIPRKGDFWSPALVQTQGVHPSPTYSFHGTMGPDGKPYNVSGNPGDIQEPQLQFDTKKERHLGPKPGARPVTQPAMRPDRLPLPRSDEVLPLAYAPYGTSLTVSYPSSQNQEHYRQGQNYQQAAPSHLSSLNPMPAAPSYPQDRQQPYDSDHTPQASSSNTFEMPKFKQPPRFDEHSPSLTRSHERFAPYAPYGMSPTAFYQPSQNQGHYEQGHNYQHAAPSHQSHSDFYQGHASRHQYAEPSYPEQEYPFRQGPIPKHHPGVTPPPTRSKPLYKGISVPPISEAFPQRRASPSTDIVLEHPHQPPQTIRSEYKADRSIKGQAARDSHALTQKGSYRSSITQQEVALPQPGQPQSYSYQDLLTFEIPSPHTTSLEITVESTQDAAIRLATNTGTKVGVLNYSNASYAGGSAFNGHNGEEESLIRTTTLFGSLSRLIDHSINLEEELKKPHTTIRYKAETTQTLRKDNGVLISPNISIFRQLKSKTRKYEELASPTVVTVVSSAAVNLNHERPSNYAEITKQKIYSQLAAFAKEGIDSIVLGAWGCGSFMNNPNEIASIYKDFLNNEFKGTFKKVVFAIPRDNHFSTFRSILEAK